MKVGEQNQNLNDLQTSIERLSDGVLNAAKNQEGNVSSSVVQNINVRLAKLEQENAQLGKNFKDSIEDLKSDIQVPADSV